MTTDEEKAEKAICKKCSWKGINGQCFEHGSKNCSKVQAYLDGLADGRKEKAEPHKNLSDTELLIEQWR